MQASPRKSVKSYQSATTPIGFNPPLPPAKGSFSIYIIAHWFVGALLALAVISPIGYHIQAIYRNNLAQKWAHWFHINPKDKSRYAPGKEMLPVAFFSFFFVLPVFISAVLFQLTKLQVRGTMHHWLHNKPNVFGRLVSVGELLFIIVALTGNIVVFYHAYTFQSTLGKPQLAVISIALAFAGLYNMVFLALPATRHCFWMEWLNLPWARAVKYHRWFGIATIFCYVVHFVIFFIQYAKTHTLAHELLPCFNCDLALEGRDPWINVFGELSLLCMLIMGATSIPYVRRHYYSTFKMTHFLFIPAAFLAVMHYEQIIVWIFVSLVLYIVNRMYSSSTVATPVAIETAAALPGHVTQLTFKCSTTYQPGDIVYIQVPAISKVQWHPFSVASTPLHTPGLLTVYIKALGPWTSHLYDYIKLSSAQNPKGDTIDPVIYLDSGYTPPAPLSPKYTSVVFIGGGIGVTPLMGQIMHLLYSTPHQIVYLIWHVKTVEMVHQFQDWLQELESVAAKNNCRLQLKLHVTQQDISEISIETEEPVHDFKLEHSSAEPRQYSHLSTARKLVVLSLAFLISGVLFYYVRYRQKITSINASWWPLQRFMETLVVIVGSFFAYGAAIIGRSTPSKHTSELPHKPDTRAMSREEFLTHYSVQFERANWSEIFQSIESERTSSVPRSIGVYVSGPKALSTAVDNIIFDNHLYEMHQEEFEM